MENIYEKFKFPLLHIRLQESISSGTWVLGMTIVVFGTKSKAFKIIQKKDTC